MKKHFLIFLILAAAAAAVYSGALDYPFQFDDNHVVVQNREIREPSGLYRFFLMPGMEWEKKTVAGFYRPVLYASYTFNRVVFGPSPGPFRAVNLLLHLLCAFLVYLAGLAFIEKARPGGRAWLWALLAALVFCVHPVQTESVIFITARSVLLAAFFCLLSLYLYLTYLGRRKAWLLALSAASYALALLSKESAAPFAAVLLLTGISLRRENERATALKPLAPHIILAASFTVFRAVYLALVSPMGGSLGWAGHWLTQVSVLPRYLLLILAPFGLSVDHYVPRPGSPLGPWLLSGLALLGVIAYFSRRLFRGRPVLTALLLWPLLVMLPEMLIPLKDPMVEYRLYLPLAGTVILAAALLHRLDLRHGPRYGLVLPLLVVAALGAVSYQRTKVWASPSALWDDAVKKSPLLARPHINYGIELARAGDLKGAREHLEEAVRLEPGEFEEAYVNLGNIYAEGGEYEKAARMQERALAMNPKNQAAYMNLALIFLNSGNYEAAYKTYLRMGEAFPSEPDIFLLAADNLRRHGREDLADRLLEGYDGRLRKSSQPRP